MKHRAEERTINGKAITDGLNTGPRAVRLLRAASTIVGGDAALARSLDIRETLLAKFMSGRYELPPQLLLQAVDIILEEREARRRSPGRKRATEGPKPDA